MEHAINKIKKKYIHTHIHRYRLTYIHTHMHASIHTHTLYVSTVS